jgi:hypothetical protein
LTFHQFKLIIYKEEKIMGEIKQVVSKVKGVADIVFCLDITGSMQPCIDSVKTNVGSFVETIKNSNPNQPIDWRARVMGYRDFNVDPEPIINNMDFVTTPEEIQNQLNSLNATGGGDEPESTLDAIMYGVLQSKWRSPCHKTIVVFTDAPTLPNLNTKTTNELGITDSFDVFKQILYENHVKLFLYGPRDPIYEEISKESRMSVEQMENAGDGLRNLDFKRILETIGKTVSEAAASGGVL